MTSTLSSVLVPTTLLGWETTPGRLLLSQGISPCVHSQCPLILEISQHACVLNLQVYCLYTLLDFKWFVSILFPTDLYLPLSVTAGCVLIFFLISKSLPRCLGTCAVTILLSTVSMVIVCVVVIYKRSKQSKIFTKSSVMLQGWNYDTISECIILFYL